MYLLDAMSSPEREQFEERFVDDEALFYEIVERENEFVDRYASDAMSPSERKQFERSLAANPARLQKVENARLLRDFVIEQGTEPRTITIAERSGFLNKLSDLFRMPVLQLASVGLVLLFALWSTYLLVENRRLRSLEQELATAWDRQAELQSQIDSGQDTIGHLGVELSETQTRVKELEQAVATLKPRDERPAQQGSAIQPTIATLVLSSAIGRDGGPAHVPSLELLPTATRVLLVIPLDEAAERVTVRLNGRNVATGLRIQTRAGEPTVSVTIPVSALKDGANNVHILDSSGETIAERNFSIVRK